MLGCSDSTDGETGSDSGRGMVVGTTSGGLLTGAGEGVALVELSGVLPLDEMSPTVKLARSLSSSRDFAGRIAPSETDVATAGLLGRPGGPGLPERLDARDLRRFSSADSAKWLDNNGEGDEGEPCMSSDADREGWSRPVPAAETGSEPLRTTWFSNGT